MNLLAKKQKLEARISALQDKKGIYAIDLIIAGVVGLLVLALITVVVLIILGQMQSNTTLAPVNGTAYNAIGLTNTAVATVPTWFVTILTVVIAVGLITLVLVIRQISQQGGGRE